MNIENIIIRQIKEADKDNWTKLFINYAEFYESKITDEIINNVWNWIHSKEHELEAIVAELESEIIALLIIVVCQVLYVEKILVF